MILAGYYYARTGDRDFIAGAVGPRRPRAAAGSTTTATWTATASSSTPAAIPTGLVHQGWKDSSDSVSHERRHARRGADCALRGAGLRVRGQAAGRTAGRRCSASTTARATLAAPGEGAARAVRARVLVATISAPTPWRSTASKRPCEVRASNAGHCLFTGIATPPRARRVAETLMGEAFFTGWGVRTLAAGEVRYNPMSYHNGSIWPHDNALVGGGLRPLRDARAGRAHPRRTVRRQPVRRSVPHAGALLRLPPAGRRRADAVPGGVLAPGVVGGAVFMLLAGDARSVDRRRRAPDHDSTTACCRSSCRTCGSRDLRVGNGSVDLVLERQPRDLGVQVERNDAKAEILVVK